jgi:biopolymer transport protein ExbD
MEVELNLAAMLDVAFQLLAFFILTFRPSPIEGQLRLHLPPPRPITTLPNAESPGSDEANPSPVEGLNSIVISVFATPSGQIDAIAIGENEIPDVETLRRQVRAMFADPVLQFDQVLIQASTGLSYQSLLEVVEVCTQSPLANGARLTKVGLAELATH